MPPTPSLPVGTSWPALLRALPIVGIILVLSACQKGEPEAGSTPPPPQSQARFVLPEDGATVAPTFQVVMTVDGMTIEPAGEIRDDAGHFHILVDAPFIAAGEVIPADANHVHFGTGATEVELTLAPGEHTLRLQVANGAHIAYDARQFGSEITVEVKSP